MSDKRGRNKISARIVRPGGKAEKRPSPDHMADAVFEKPLRHSAYSAESHRFSCASRPLWRSAWCCTYYCKIWERSQAGSIT